MLSKIDKSANWVLSGGHLPLQGILKPLLGTAETAKEISCLDAQTFQFSGLTEMGWALWWI
jgi:hypothetical protein